MTQAFTSFDTTDQRLRITLFQQYRREVEEIDARIDLDADQRLAEVIEYQLCNGWDFLTAEQTGDLTDGPILSDDAEFDDQGTLLSYTRKYWYAAYQIHDPIVQLLTHGYVDFPSA